jgi:hypothetical protein
VADADRAVAGDRVDLRRISPSLRLRPKPAPVEAQKLQPIRQPACDEMQTDQPYL